MMITAHSPTGYDGVLVDVPQVLHRVGLRHLLGRIRRKLAGGRLVVGSGEAADAAVRGVVLPRPQDAIQRLVGREHEANRVGLTVLVGQLPEGLHGLRVLDDDVARDLVAEVVEEQRAGDQQDLLAAFPVAVRVVELDEGVADLQATVEALRRAFVDGRLEAARRARPCAR
jgi:hypothetical protein